MISEKQFKELKEYYSRPEMERVAKSTINADWVQDINPIVEIFKDPFNDYLLLVHEDYLEWGPHHSDIICRHDGPARIDKCGKHILYFVQDPDDEENSISLTHSEWFKRIMEI